MYDTITNYNKQHSPDKFVNKLKSKKWNQMFLTLNT